MSHVALSEGELQVREVSARGQLHRNQIHGLPTAAENIRTPNILRRALRVASSRPDNILNVFHNPLILCN